MPGLIGPRLWTQAATVLHRSRATYAAAVDAAGIQKSNMLHTPNTKINKIHEAWATLHGYRTKAQASSAKLDRSSGLGYHRINGKVQQRSRFVGPSHITNRRHAHLVRSSTRAARSTLESKPIKDLLKAVASPGDRDNGYRDKLQAPSTRPKRQASSLKLRKFSEFQAK